MVLRSRTVRTSTLSDSACDRCRRAWRVLAIGQYAANAGPWRWSWFHMNPVIEDEALAGRVRRTLKIWQPSFVELHKRLFVEGMISKHVFDFVSIPTQS